MTKANAASATVGERLRAWRESAGLLQEDIAREARNCGLDWKAATVGVIETGRRNVTLDEFLRLPLIVTAFGDDHLDSATADYFLGPYAPLLNPSPEAGDRDRLLAIALRVYSERNVPLEVEAQGQAERYAAQALGISEYDIPSLARELWGRSLTAERDARAQEAAGDDAAARSIQAHRGHVGRQLLAELRSKVDEIHSEWDRHSMQIWGRSWNEQIDALVDAGHDRGEAWRLASREVAAAMEKEEAAG